MVEQTYLNESIYRLNGKRKAKQNICYVNDSLFYVSLKELAGKCQYTGLLSPRFI